MRSRPIRESWPIIDSADNCIIRRTVDVYNWGGSGFAPVEYMIGRLLSDEFRPYAIANRGVNLWQAADADSCGMEAAYAACLVDQLLCSQHMGDRQTDRLTTGLGLFAMLAHLLPSLQVVDHRH